MRTMFKALAGAGLIAAAVALPTAQAQDVKEVNFGIISTESSTNLKKSWEPFLEAMSKGTGLKINGFYAFPIMAGVIEAMRFGKIQVAWFGNKSAMEAVDRSGGEIFAQTVDVEGNPGYWSHLIVHKDSPYEKLEDVLKCDKTVDFGIGDPNSTSGFLGTDDLFAAKSVDPKECFKTVRNASHEANAMAVANKQVMVATNNSENLRRLETTAPEARKNLKIIWTSPLIPSDPLVWRKDLDPSVKSKLYTWVMTYGRNGTPDEVNQARKVMAVLGWAPFRPSSDAQLYPIRQLELNKQVLKVKSDDKLSNADKKAKLAELQKQIEEIAALADKTPSM